jgi:hypothetical protein
MQRPQKDFAVAGGGLQSLSHPISRSGDRFCGAVRTIEGTQRLRVTGRLTARSARSLARGAARSYNRSTELSLPRHAFPRTHGDTRTRKLTNPVNKKHACATLRTHDSYETEGVNS